MSEKVKVIVYVPVKISVPYVIEVNNPNDLEEVKESLDTIISEDPSGWEHDPDFYENLGYHLKTSIDKLKESDLEDIVYPYYR